MDRQQTIIVAQNQPPPSPDVPARLRKLMLRLAQLSPGYAYTLTLYLPESGDPMWAIQSVGKLENAR